MLVLVRKLNEELVIGTQGIRLKIVDVRGGRVRLGIEAPDDVRIERSEAQFSPDMPARKMAEPAAT